MIIELHAAKKNQKNLYGKNYGSLMREKFDLDKLDALDEVVFVHLAPKIYSINLDFFLGMFGESVRKLTPAGFRTKYVFNVRPATQRDISSWLVDAQYANV